MTTDIRLKLSFRAHPKCKKLRIRLGEAGVLGFIYLLMFAAESKSRGALEGMDEEDIALAADYRSDPQEFVSLLTQLRLLDFDGDTYSIHDWRANNPYAAGAAERSKLARRAANARWRTEKGMSINQVTEKQRLNDENNTPGTKVQCPEQGRAMQGEKKGNAPSPSPSPSPSPIEISSKPSVPACPHEEIISAYHEILPERPRITVSLWKGSVEAKALESRWREREEHQNVDWWRELFTAVRSNNFWMNRDGKWDKFNLRWMVTKTNFIKCVEHWENAA